jgi:hypothetical protein
MDRTIFWITAVAAACILVLFSLPLLSGTIYTINDLTDFHLPMRRFYADALSKGTDFTWCPLIFCGFDLHAEGQLGMYHPLHLFLYRFLPLTTAFNLELVLSYPAMLLGMYFFCRRWKFSPGASMFGAYTFTFNSFMFMRFQHLNQIGTIAHLPWAVLCCDIIMRGGSRKQMQLSFIALTLLTGSQLLLGFPQAFWMISIIEAVYVLILAVSLGVYFPLLGVLSSKLLGVLLGSVQLIPTLASIPLSTRATPTLEYLGEYSFHPINFLQTISPYFFREPIIPYSCVWEGTFYTGAVAVVLCIWLLTRKADMVKHKVILTIAMFLAATGLIMALGKYMPTFSMVMSLPVFGLFRCPNRYSLFSHFGLSITAACALSCLIEAMRDCRRLTKSTGVFTVIIGGMAVFSLLYALQVSRDPQHWLSKNINPPYMAALGSALLALSAAAVIGALKGYRWGVLAIVVMQVADLGIYCESFVLSQGKVMSYADFVNGIKTPPINKGERVFTDNINFVKDNQLLLKDLQLSRGYVALLPRKELDPYKFSAIRITGATWARVDLGPDKMDQWVSLNGSLPRVKLYCRATASNDVNSQIDKIDLKTTALVSKEISLTGDIPGEAKIVREVPGEIEIAANVNSRQLLMISESFHPGWHVDVNGERREVIQVFGDYMGCILDPGIHKVRFLWNFTSLMIGKSISIVIGLAMFIWLAVLVAPELFVRLNKKKLQT